MSEHDSAVLTIVRWADEHDLTVKVDQAEDLLKRLGTVLPNRQPWTRWTDAMRAELQERVERGEAPREIAAGMGLSAGRINGALTRMREGRL